MNLASTTTFALARKLVSGAVRAKRFLFTRLKTDKEWMVPPAESVLRQLPPVAIHINVERLHGSFVAPNPTIEVQCLSPENSTVLGRLSYGLSPLSDRIYVDGLFVEPAFRGKGYARSLLLAVARHCSGDSSIIPITPLHELGSSKSFWNELRTGIVPGLSVTMDIRVSEMDAEKQRWAAPSVAGV